MSSDVQLWEGVAAFVSATFVLPIIQQPRWSSARRSLVTLVYSLVVGLVTAYLSGAFAGVHDFRAGVGSVLTMLVATIALYKGVAKPMGIAPAIENATSPAPPESRHRGY